MADYPVAGRAALITAARQEGGARRRPVPSHPEGAVFIECDALLADGAVAHLRPVHPGDLDELVALHEAMSP